MWVLQLKDMRNTRVGDPASPIARAETKEELEKFVERETVIMYYEEVYGKTFGKDSPLEWYIRPGKDNDHEYINAGDADLWAERARADFEAQVMSLPEASKV